MVGIGGKTELKFGPDPAGHLFTNRVHHQPASWQMDGIQFIEVKTKG